MPTTPRQAKEIFLAAIEKATMAERAAFVDEACAGDASLRDKVEGLLRAHDQPGSFLDKPAAELRAHTLLSPAEVAEGELGTSAGDTRLPDGDHGSSEAVGSYLGPYRLLQKLGEGGMGTVWVAEQQEPVKRRVAVKLIKPGQDSAQVLRRFDAERQALALMDHSNIAKVLDAGATDNGRPYFVMELVPGVSITRYCDELHLPIRERLALFIPVCQAIQHAHQKGIIHRDIKPSNVLVCMQDGRPVPKVIDFGVAKALHQRLTEDSMYTEVGAVIGTLEYMSPEQAEMSPLGVDTRADVYALGVLLYELLTGTTPLDKKRLRSAAYTEMVRLIREEQPPKPSTRLTDSKESLANVAAMRRTEPAGLTKEVRGELDWIVMKALEKDRTRRYETANGFAMDVQRYLAAEPVLAAPASQWYRLRKMVRRHRGPVAAAGLVLLALVGGITGTTWGLLRAVAERDAKDAALKAEQQAREDETKARQQAFAALRSMTTDVVERKFAQETVLTEDDRTFLRGIIAQFDAFAAIQGGDADSRAVRAEGRLRVGRMRSRLGELQEAEQDYDRALSIYKQLAAEFPSQSEFRQQLAGSHTGRGNLLYVTGRAQEAEQDYTQALSICKQLAADFPSRPEFRQDLANNHNNRGNLLRTTGRPHVAGQDYDQALHIQKQLAADFPSRPEFRQQLAGSHNDRGNLLSDTGGLKKAEQDYDQALSIHKQLAADFPSRPEFRQDLATSHNNRGNLLRATGRLREAEQDYDQALRIQKQLAADFPSRPEFRQDLARTHNNGGLLLHATGRLQEAEKNLNEALTILKQLAADFPNQPDLRNELANICVNLALLHEKQGNWATAKRLLLEGRPDHLNALKANPRNPDYRRFYRNHLNVLTRVHAALLEQEDAVRTAETCRDLGWNGPADTYDAACSLSLCVPIVAVHDKLDAKHRKEAAQFYGDAAMKLLREAVSKGFKDVAHIKKDTDLDPLRQREDFQKLIAELQVKGK